MSNDRSALRARLLLSAIVVGTLAAPALVGLSSAGAVRSTAPDPLPALRSDPGQPAPTPSWVQTPALPGSKTAYYYNWSGYAAQAKAPFTLVHSTYVQPTVTCPVKKAYTVFWVGFDGFTNSTVEQDGTLAYCSGTTPEYEAWWEMYPTNDITAVPSVAVAPGDKINATVTFQGGVYTMTVKDMTSGTHFTRTAKCAKGLTCPRDSAEWIVERPGYGGENYAPLADWGTMNLPGDQAATGGGAGRPVSAFTNTPIDMVNLADTYLLAAVTALDTAGSTFTDTWQADK